LTNQQGEVVLDMFAVVPYVVEVVPFRAVAQLKDRVAREISHRVLEVKGQGLVAKAVLVRKLIKGVAK
jgi:hypothetical protein